MAKSAEAFRTISEVADELELQKHVLRFWEVKFPQIKPMKRGGGRRYYRPADMELLRGIRHLLHAEGYTIKGVQRILRERGIDAVKRVGADLAAGLKIEKPIPAGERDVPVTAAGAARVAEHHEPPAAKLATATPALATSRETRTEPSKGSSGRVTSSESRVTARAGEIARMISELETCRSILKGTAADAAARANEPAAKRAVGAAG